MMIDFRDLGDEAPERWGNGGWGGKEYGNVNNVWDGERWRRCLQAVYNNTDI